MYYADVAYTKSTLLLIEKISQCGGSRFRLSPSTVIRAFARGAMGRRIDPSW